MLSVSSMRTIDRFIGVPITIVVTLCAYLSNLVRSIPASPKNILFIKLSEMGSTICAEPAIESIGDETKAKLHIVTFKESEAVLSILSTDFEKRSFFIRTDSLARLIMDTFLFIVWAWRHRFDAVVDFELFSCYSALLSFFSGASHRVGFHSVSGEGLYRGDLFNEPVAYSPDIHIASNFMKLAVALHGVEKANKQPLTVSKKKTSTAVDKLVSELLNSTFSSFNQGQDRLIVINANASFYLQQRRWPLVSYCELIKLLLAADGRNYVVLTGNGAEKEELTKLTDKIDSERCVELAGQLSLEDFIALLDRATVFLSNDSGPAHFAAKSQVKTLVLFGPETPELYQPLGAQIEVLYANLECSPCVNAGNMKMCTCNDNKCMKAISVESVDKKLKQIFGRRDK